MSDLGFLLQSGIRNIELDLVGRIQSAITAGLIDTGVGVAALAEALGIAFGNPADLEAVHQQVASEMRLAVIDAYQSRVLAGRQDYGPRSGSPARLSGRLLKALETEDLVVGTARGIDFVDADRLYQEAKHFARLNFGTEGPGDHGEPARQVPISLFGATLFTVSLDWAASPAFYLPAGLFLGGGGSWFNRNAERRGQDVFYPTGELPASFLKARAGKKGRADHPAKAIAARRFLDEGLAVLAVELPPAYNRLMQRWLESTPPQLKRLSVTVPTLRGGRVSLETHHLR